MVGFPASYPYPYLDGVSSSQKEKVVYLPHHHTMATLSPSLTGKRQQARVKQVLLGVLGEYPPLESHSAGAGDKDLVALEVGGVGRRGGGERGRSLQGPRTRSCVKFAIEPWGVSLVVQPYAPPWFR